MDLPYSARTALQSLLREKWINLLSCITVAASMLISVLILVIMFNLERFTSSLPDQFKMVVYLQDELSEPERQNIMHTLRAKPYAAGLSYISKEDALAELKRSLKEVSNAVEGLEENPLSSSIELRLKKEQVSAGSVQTIAADIKKIEGVDDVYYESRVAETVYVLKSSIEKVSVAVLGIVLLVILFVISSTVKILFYRRKNEIEIIKLLGATSGFIRTPFLIEGAALGLIGGLLASLAAGGIYMSLATQFGALLPVVKVLTVPPEVFIGLPCAGLLMGIIGAVISVGRFKLP